MRTKRHTLHVPSNLHIMLGLDTVHEIPTLPWTEARARIERPPVTVRHAGKTYTGQISGVKFARVTIWRTADDWQTWEWSWKAIAHHLNSGIPLTT